MSDVTETGPGDLSRTLAACREHFVVAGLFSAAVNLLYLAPTLFMLQVYDRVLSSFSSTTLVFMTLLLVVALLVMGVLDWARSQVLIRLGTRFDRRLSDRLLAVLIDVRWRGGGQDAREAMRDLDMLRQTLSGAGVHALLDAPWAVIYLGVVFLLDPWLGWLTVAGMILLGLLAVANERAVHKTLEGANAAARRSYGMSDALLRDGETIKAMGLQTGLVKRAGEQRTLSLGLQAVASSRSAGYTAWIKGGRMALQSLALALGAALVLDQQISGGAMFAGSILMSRALAPIEQAVGAWKGLSAAKEAYDRLKRLMASVPPPVAATRLPAPSGAVQLEGVSFTLPKQERPLLSGISLAVAAGETLGVVGPSAAGKSTLIRVMLGIWPATEGTVRLDGADINQWPRDDLGQYLGYLPQSVEFFSGTVRENIARFTDCPDEAVIAAAQAANVHDMILHLPRGYDTPLGDGAYVPSGGQRQRLGLARALFGEPNFVVLDEPYASLDAEGENALMEALRRLKARGATVIVVAHRLASLATADRIVLVRDGRIEMIGPRAEMITRLTGGTVVPLPGAAGRQA